VNWELALMDLTNALYNSLEPTAHELLVNLLRRESREDITTTARNCLRGKDLSEAALRNDTSLEIFVSAAKDSNQIVAEAGAGVLRRALKEDPRLFSKENVNKAIAALASYLVNAETRAQDEKRILTNPEFKLARELVAFINSRPGLLPEDLVSRISSIASKT